MRGMLGDIKKVAAIIADLYELETENKEYWGAVEIVNCFLSILHFGGAI